LASGCIWTGWKSSLGNLDKTSCGKWVHITKWPLVVSSGRGPISSPYHFRVSWSIHLLTYHCPIQRLESDSGAFSISHPCIFSVPFSPLVGRAMIESNSGFCMSPGRSFITNHFYVPLIQLWALSWPVGQQDCMCCGLACYQEVCLSLGPFAKCIVAVFIKIKWILSLKSHLLLWLKWRYLECFFKENLSLWFPITETQAPFHTC
jgi:hypothetical protein